ncbi:hypothetical protein MKY84_01175 [Chryseomicrobium sp. FSL W7-1435]|uniref:hypothetical protein n=1 Tax=Chryseomicrobium sp. FSL W7-1435 TaxID=2921704 RepID=UPI00315AE885
MSKIPLEIIKELGAKGMDYAKKNPGQVKAALAMAPALLKTLTDLNDKKHEWHLNKLKKKSDVDKMEYRETRYMRYQDQILPNLESYNYAKLDECLSEVESFLMQLKSEMTVIKRPKLMPRVAKWQKVKLQLESHRDSRFYSELVRVNEDVGYDSAFLAKSVQAHFRELPTLEARKEFVRQFTEKDEQKLALDFLKYN